MGISVNLGLSIVSVFGNGVPFVSAIIAYLLGAVVVGLDMWITAYRREKASTIASAKAAETVSRLAAASGASVAAEEKVEIGRIKEQFDLYKAETENLIEELEYQRQMIQLLDDENKRKNDTIADLEQINISQREWCRLQANQIERLLATDTDSVDVVEEREEELAGMKEEEEEDGISMPKSGLEKDAFDNFVERLERMTKTPHGSFSDLLREERMETPDEDEAKASFKGTIGSLDGGGQSPIAPRRKRLEPKPSSETLSESETIIKSETLWQNELQKEKREEEETQEEKVREEKVVPEVQRPNVPVILRKKQGKMWSKTKKGWEKEGGMEKTPEGSIVDLLEEEATEAEEDSKGFLVIFKRNSQILSSEL